LIAQLIDRRHLVQSVFSTFAAPAISPLARTDWVTDDLTWRGRDPITRSSGSRGTSTTPRPGRRSARPATSTTTRADRWGLRWPAGRRGGGGDRRRPVTGDDCRRRRRAGPPPPALVDATGRVRALGPIFALAVVLRAQRRRPRRRPGTVLARRRQRHGRHLRRRREFVAWLQSLGTPAVTTVLGYVYVYGYAFLVTFPLVAYLALEDQRYLQATATAYVVNYGVGLVCYDAVHRLRPAELHARYGPVAAVRRLAALPAADEPDQHEHERLPFATHLAVGDRRLAGRPDARYLPALAAGGSGSRHARRARDDVPSAFTGPSTWSPVSVLATGPSPSPRGSTPYRRRRSDSATATLTTGTATAVANPEDDHPSFSNTGSYPLAMGERPVQRAEVRVVGPRTV